MVLDLVMRVSWLCFILFDTGACLPAFVKGQLGSVKRVGPLGWVPGTGAVDAVSWLPGTGGVGTGRVLTGVLDGGSSGSVRVGGGGSSGSVRVGGGGSSGSVRVGGGDWTSGTRGVGTRVSGAGSSGHLKVGSSGVGNAGHLKVGSSGVGNAAGVGAGSLTSGTRRVGAGSLTSGVGRVGAGSSGTSVVDLSSSVTAGAGLGSSVSKNIVLGSPGTAGSAASGVRSPFLVGFPWVNAPTGGVPSAKLWNWMPSQAFPEYNAWYTHQLPVGMVMAPPMLPSTYIIQNGNGYQRGREVFSYSKYSDDVYSPFPLSPVLSQNPESVPVTGSQGTKV